MNAALHEVGLSAASDPRADGPGVVVVAGANAATLALVALHADRGRTCFAVTSPAHELNPDEAWALLCAGAEDVLSFDEKPAPAIAARLKRFSEIEKVMASALVAENLRGRSVAWRRFLTRLIDTTLNTRAHILIMGETGTGKEMAARLVHTLGHSKKPDLVVVDCTTIVPDLAGSELFGHERGAFTGAERSREGAVALADGGTLFLDEVGELPAQLQAQLLRAVQDHTYKKVGGNQWESSEFRLVCATNRDLIEEVEAGHFRRDLYYRISGEVLRTPPLRERREDIAELALAFAIEATGDGACTLSPPLREYLYQREYAGNVRDLRRLVHSIARRHHGHGSITIGSIPREERTFHLSGPTGAASGEDRNNEAILSDGQIRAALAQGLGLKDVGRLAEEAAIRIALEASPTQREAAAKLGVTERTLQLRRAGVRAHTGDRNGNGRGMHRPPEHPGRDA